MDFQFVNRLTEEEWLAFINFGTTHYCRKKGNLSIHPATMVSVSRDYKDLKGTPYILVSASDGNNFLCNYRANDFCISMTNNGMIVQSPAIVLDDELRIFLTARFGDKYLKKLEKYRIEEVKKEMNKLKEYATLENHEIEFWNQILK